MNYLEGQINELRGDLAESYDREKDMKERLADQEVEMMDVQRRLDNAEKLMKNFAQWTSAGK